jgi:hypothetical protein
MTHHQTSKSTSAIWIASFFVTEALHFPLALVSHRIVRFPGMVPSGDVPQFRPVLIAGVTAEICCMAASKNGKLPAISLSKCVS